jgi:hypothetical protein
MLHTYKPPRVLYFLGCTTSLAAGAFVVGYLAGPFLSTSHSLALTLSNPLWLARLYLVMDCQDMAPKSSSPVPIHLSEHIHPARQPFQLCMGRQVGFAAAAFVSGAFPLPPPWLSIFQGLPTHRKIAWNIHSL